MDPLSRCTCRIVRLPTLPFPKPPLGPDLGSLVPIWLSIPPLMLCMIVHTTSELHFPGNCLKGSRPLLSFDSTFTSTPALLLIKDLLAQIFGVPPNARKIKPFVDHLMGFTFADGKVWIRCFEIRESDVSKAEARKEDTDNNSKTTAGGEKKRRRARRRRRRKRRQHQETRPS